MVAYRLYCMDMLAHTDWQALSRHCWSEWAARREVQDDKTKNGPNYYVLRRHRLGKRMVEVIGMLVASGELTTTKAGRLLAVGAHNVHRVLSEYR